MTSLQEVIKQSLKSQNGKPVEGEVKEANAKMIRHVAGGSVAESAGLQPGDLLTKINQQPAALVNWNKIAFDQEMQYEIIKANRVELIELETSPIPLGVELTSTASALVKQAKSENIDPVELIFLWELELWEDLKQACGKDAEAGLFETLINLFRKRVDWEGNPRMLLYGAAIYELGETEPGLALIQEFVDKYEQHWTTEFQAIARYYFAKEKLARNDRQTATELLDQAMRFKQYRAFHELYRTNNGSAPPTATEWSGRPFPLPCSLPRLEGEGSIDFAAEIENLDRDQMLIVCLMATYRSNGPYDDFLKLYRRWHQQLGDFLGKLYVITAKTDTDAFTKGWLETEKRCRQDGIPIEVLLDSTFVLAQAFQQEIAPMLIGVNRAGEVVGFKLGEEVEFMEALQRCAGK